MDVSNLLKALSDLQAERARIDAAIEKLTALIADLSPTQPRQLSGLFQIDGGGAGMVVRGYAALAHQILLQRGPMHIRDLLPLIAEARGEKEVDRASVESSIHKAIQAGPWKDKIYKQGPGIYAAKD